MQPSSFLCPRCKCSACYPLHRKGLDWLVYLVEARPVRCLTCNKRFYARYSIDGYQVKVGPAPRHAESESKKAA